MKAKDANRLTALRMLKTALTNKSIEKGRALEEPEELQVVSMLVKQRRDSIEQFTKGGRQDLADKEQAEIAILNAYLPAVGLGRGNRGGGCGGDRRDRRHQREGHGQGHEGGDGRARRQDRRRQEGQRGRQSQTGLITFVPRLFTTFTNPGQTFSPGRPSITLKGLVSLSPSSLGL